MRPRASAGSPRLGVCTGSCISFPSCALRFSVFLRPKMQRPGRVPLEEQDALGPRQLLPLASSAFAASSPSLLPRLPPHAPVPSLLTRSP